MSASEQKKERVKDTQSQFKSDKRSTITNRCKKAQDDKLLQAKIKSGSAIQLQKNKTGLPDQLKSGAENLSGYSLDHVKVHFNSSKPAAVQAHAYAQGSNIHLASGQEKHLPHEAWHVVQQMQGRVKPTTKVSGMAVNDNVSLEKEADVMGGKALQMKFSKLSNNAKSISKSNQEIVQRSVIQLNGYDAIINLTDAAKKHYKHHKNTFLPKNDDELVEYIRDEYDSFVDKGDGRWVLDLGEYDTYSRKDKEYELWTIVMLDQSEAGKEVYLVKHYGPTVSSN